ncbi:MAG: hypothetical protein JWO06_2752 [Bacteroidota bacterium]|nr:hypothetical protein [Bacteroidota bacterium]
MGLFDMFKKSDKKMTLEEADAVNKKFTSENPVPTSDENGQMRKAAGLLSSQKFQESLDIFKQLANDYPGNSALYLSQVGVNYYFLNDFENALDYYTQALNKGFDKGMSDDNIWEACEALYNKAGDKSYLQKYLSLLPGGNHTKDANKLLAK